MAADAAAAERDLCVALLMGLHAAEAGKNNYFKWAAGKIQSAAAIRNAKD